MRTITWMLAVTVAAGCAGPRTVEPPSIWRLDTVTETAAAVAPRPGPTLVVAAPRAAPGFDTTDVLYARRPHELAAYATHRWADTPARMLAPLVAGALARTGAWGAVVTRAAVRGDLRLDLADVTLVHEFVDTPSVVRVTARAELVSLDLRRALGVREFAIVVPAPSDDPYGGVRAANEAFAALSAEIAHWAATASRE